MPALLGADAAPVADVLAMLAQRLWPRGWAMKYLCNVQTVEAVIIIVAVVAIVFIVGAMLG